MRCPLCRRGGVVHLVEIEGMRLRKHLTSNNLLEVVQSGLGLLLCLMVEVFWDG